MKKIYALVLALALAAGLAAPAAAAGEETAYAVSPWAYEALADAYAMGMVDDNYGAYLGAPITQEGLSVLTGAVGAKLANLGLEQRGGSDAALVIDATRGGVMNALYQEAAAYVLPGVEEGAVAFLTGLGVVKGDQGGNLRLERICTYEEAMVMAERLVLAVYDLKDAGSKGLLWKATGNGNTLYLLGTIHVDRSNIYPFHKSLRGALNEAQEVIFEIELNDPQGMAEFMTMQMYTDGTNLRDHVSEQLYADTVAIFGMLGLSEEQTAAYKPWALMLTLQNVLTQDESTVANMAVDSYLTAAAANAGKTISAVESYAFQGAIFDTLSEEYQLAGLEGGVAMVKAALSGESTGSAEDDAAIQEALAAQSALMDAMMEAWKSRDVEAFVSIYDKQAIVESTDELEARLFTDRDPHMIEAAAAYLEREGENTYFLAVGAGHMTDPGGIVSGLRALGYTVELVP